MEAAAEAMASFAQPAGGVRADPAAVDDFKGRLTTMAANAAQGMSFGLGDEFSGAIAGAKSLADGGEFCLPIGRSATTLVPIWRRSTTATLRRQRLDT